MSGADPQVTERAFMPDIPVCLRWTRMPGLAWP